MYTAFKASSPVVMDGQAGAEERIELESAVPGRNSREQTGIPQVVSLLARLG